MSRDLAQAKALERLSSPKVLALDKLPPVDGSVPPKHAPTIMSDTIESFWAVIEAAPQEEDLDADLEALELLEAESAVIAAQAGV